MKLYLVQERAKAQKYTGLSVDVFAIKGIYKSKERAMCAKRGLDTVVTEIDSDLFEVVE